MSIQAMKLLNFKKMNVKLSTRYTAAFLIFDNTYILAMQPVLIGFFQGANLHLE